MKTTESGVKMMKELRTKIMTIDAEFPSELDQERIIMSRSYNVSDTRRFKYDIMEKGLVGENTMVDNLRKYGNKDWVFLRNMWLDDFGRCENDLTVITNNRPYVFEIKQYVGEYTHNNGICTPNNRKIKRSPVGQARNNLLNLQKITREYSYDIQVKGALVFTGIDNEVNVQTPVEDIEVVERNGLRKYILGMLEDEEIHRYNKPLNAKNLINYYQKYEIENPFMAKQLSEDEIKNLQKGICCVNCGTFDIKITNQQYIECDCKFHEPREEAIVRTICEYGVLNPTKDLRIGELLEFLDYQISRSYLKEILKKHFKMVSKQRYTYYINKKLPFHKIRHEFNLVLPRKYYIEETNTIQYS